MSEPNLGSPVAPTEGHLDGVVGGRITGWALNKEILDTPVLVELTVDGASIGTVCAEEFRGDVARIFATNGKHGFSREVPEPLHDGKSHVVGAFFDGTGVALWDSPRSIVFELPDPSARSEGRSGPIIEGHLDSVTNGQIFGWALEVEHPEKRAALDLFIDGTFVRTAIADRWRQDLVGRGDGTCTYGFLIAIPPRFNDGNVHTIDVLFAGTETRLANSPVRIPLEPTPTGSMQSPTSIRLYLSGTNGTSSYQGLSVVIPTYNRAALLETCLLKCLECSAGLEIEFIVIDDGSKDDTPERLARLQDQFPNVRFQSIPNGGPGQARNIGAAMAKYEILMFIGDDIRPGGQDFFKAHLLAHQLFPETQTAVLGKITWPNQPDDDVTFVMAHIQGVGQQQFGFHYLEPYTWLDWRFFYTSNVSMKAAAVSDWKKDGFSSAFYAAAFEDDEFAYRLTRSTNGAFRILYVPASSAIHYHPYSVKGFIQRQISAGMMARVFAELHPEAASAIGIEVVDEALNRRGTAGYGEIGDYLAVIDGLKSWASLIETTQNLGSQNWHADLISAVFDLSYQQGCINSSKNPAANYAAAYQLILERFQQRMARASAIEVFGKLAAFKVV